MAIALLLVGAMLTPYAPLWGLGLEIVAASAIVAIRRPWDTGSVAPHHRMNDTVEPNLESPTPRSVHTSAEPPRQPLVWSRNERPETMVVPVFDVGADRIIGLRSSFDWASVSNSVLRSLGVANREATNGTGPWISATVRPRDLRDAELLAKVDLLLRSSGLTPEDLILEIEGWHESRKNRLVVERLHDLGVRIGLSMRNGDAWPPPPKTFSSMVSLYSVSASDITHRGEVTLDGMANIEAFSQTRLDRVVVRDVNRSSLALDLGSIGLKLQSGDIFNSGQMSLRSSGAFSS